MKILKSISQLKSLEFTETQKAIQKYASLITGIKSKLYPHEKNSEEHSLKLYSKGLTTTPIPIKINEGLEVLEININLIENRLEIIFGKESKFIDLALPNIRTLALKIQDKFNEFKMAFLLEEKYFSDTFKIDYNSESAELLLSVLTTVYFALIEFRSLTLKETSSINFWPHHFDLAMLMFTGNLIPGQDKTNWSYSREQINYGFLFGDEYISNPYFYVTFYPFDEKFTERKLSNGAFWYKKDWNGAILELEKLFGKPDLNKKIVYFFNETLKL